MSYRRRCASLVVGMAVLAGSLPAHADGSYRRSALVGTWVLTITPPGPVTPYIAVSTFAYGGTTTGTPAEQAPPGVVSTGGVFGQWAYTGDETYASTIVAFTYDNNGSINGTIKFNNAYTLVSKDELEGISQYVICDRGLVCPAPTANSAKLTGVRLQIQPVTQ